MIFNPKEKIQKKTNKNLFINKSKRKTPQLLKNRNRVSVQVLRVLPSRLRSKNFLVYMYAKIYTALLAIPLKIYK